MWRVSYALRKSQCLKCIKPHKYLLFAIQNTLDIQNKSVDDKELTIINEVMQSYEDQLCQGGHTDRSWEADR